MTNLREETVKAKKDYVCDLCKGKIKKGESYHYSSYVDTQIYSFRSHHHCQALSNKLKMYDKVNMCDDGLDSELFEEIVYENYIWLFSDDKLPISEKALKLHKKLGE